MKVLIFGSTGFIGSKLIKFFPDVIVANSRLDDYESLAKELRETDATHCLLVAGVTGNPNVDWCEDNKLQVVRVNVIGVSIIADLCNRRNIHLTFVSTGCIYEYDKDHPIGGPGFTETDEPNFKGSFYSYTKVLIEKIAKEFQPLILRVRMPLSDELHPRNFITKITKYQKVVNVPNSMTVLYDLLPLIPDMMEKRLTGIFNFTNPGVISHNEILGLYKQYIDPNFTWTNFSLDEQAKILKAGRSNNYLDASKLCSYYQVPDIKVSIHDLFKRMQETLGK